MPRILESDIHAMQPRPQGLSLSGKMRDPGNEVACNADNDFENECST